MFFFAAASANSPLFWLCLAVAIWPVLLLSVLLHEAGHTIWGRLAGYRVAAWGLGDGAPFFVYPPVSRPARTRFFLCRRHWFDGLTGAVYPGLLPTRRQAASMLLGGVATNLLLSLLGFALLSVAIGVWVPVSISLAGVNALLCLMALTPGRRRNGTDGAQIRALLSSDGIHVRTVAPDRILARAALWKAVGGATLLDFDRLSATVAYVELGAVETARTYLDVAIADTDPASTAYDALVRGLLYDATGQDTEAASCFSQAQAWYENQHHAAGAMLARIYGAGRNVSQLTDLNMAPIVAGFPALRTLLAFRLLCAVCAGNQPGTAVLMTAVSRYQSARLAWRSDVQDAHAFTIAARSLHRLGDRDGGATLQTQAQVAVAQMRFALADSLWLMDAFFAHLDPDDAKESLNQSPGASNR